MTKAGEKRIYKGNITSIEEYEKLGDLDLIDGYVDLRGTQIKEFTQTAAIRDLYLSGTQIKEFKQTAAIGNLYLRNTQIKEFTQTAAINGYLYLRNCENLKEFTQTAAIGDLDLRGTQIKEFTQTAAIGDLDLRNTQIKEFKQTAEIRNLDLRNTQIKEFTQTAEIRNLYLPDGATLTKKLNNFCIDSTGSNKIIVAKIQKNSKKVGSGRTILKFEDSINNEGLSKRNLGDVKLIVLHHTGSKASDENQRNFLNRTDYISVHFFVDKLGKVWRMVDENRIAYHAGASSWDGIKLKNNSLNWCSLGIEVSSDGYNFTDAQRTAMTDLVKHLLGKFTLPIQAVVRHKDIAPIRKWDPGDNLFDGLGGFEGWRESLDVPDWAKPIVAKMRAKNILTSPNTKVENMRLYHLVAVMDKYFS